MNVLLIRFSSLGDVIMTSAVVEALIHRHPRVEIHILTKQAYEDVYAADERVSRVIGIQGDESPAAIVKRLGRRSYDAVIDLHRSLRSIRVTSKLRAPLTASVQKHSLARRLMILSRNKYRRSFDVLDNYLETVAELGVSGRMLPRILPGHGSVREGRRLLAPECGPGRVIGLAPGARHATKRWDEISFASLADTLVEQGDTPVFLGDTSDTAIIETIRNTMQHDAQSFAGRTRLAGTIGMISQLDAVVCNDSGPMHIAGALGVPFVAIFGPTHPDLGFCPGYPRGRILTTNEPCSPCSLHGASPCRYRSRRCMDGIDWRKVHACLDELLS